MNHVSVGCVVAVVVVVVVVCVCLCGGREWKRDFCTGSYGTDAHIHT